MTQLRADRATVAAGLAYAVLAAAPTLVSYPDLAPSHVAARRCQVVRSSWAVTVRSTW